MQRAVRVEHVARARLLWEEEGGRALRAAADPAEEVLVFL